MMTFPVPVVAWKPSIGPGSQPLDDEVLETLEVPSEVHTFRPPRAELDAPPEVVAGAMQFLHRLLDALRATPFTVQKHTRIAIDPQAVERSESHQAVYSRVRSEARALDQQLRWWHKSAVTAHNVAAAVEPLNFVLNHHQAACQLGQKVQVRNGSQASLRCKRHRSALPSGLA